LEQREQLLVWERELSEWESALFARECGMVEDKRALRWACMECTLFMTRSHLSNETIYPGCAPLTPVGGALWSLTKF
jgi:hypothetical protein